ncbi:HC-toxin efflux carrier [Apiospora sp. TS-2023a]
MVSDRNFDTAVELGTPTPRTNLEPMNREKDGVEKQQQQPPTIPQTETEPLPRDITGWKWAVAAFTLCSSIFLYSLDGTVVAVIQATIVNEFDSLNDLSWNNVGFLMGATASNMVWGQVYGQFNSKWVYIFNVVVFEVGSALCGAARSMNALIVGRVICGIGGSGLYNGAFTLISQTTTIAERPIYVSGTGLTWGLGTVLGPIVGGAFQQSRVGWRWAFYINLFIGAACAPAWLFLLPSKDPRPGVPYKTRLREFDYVGMMLLMGCLVSLIMAINFGGLTYAWNSSQIIALFVVAAVLFLLLAVQQGLTLFVTPPRRLIPVQLVRSPLVIMLFVCTSASAAGVFVPIFFVPLFFQFTRGDGALETGVRLLPLIVVLVVTISINGALMAKFGYYMPWYFFGGLICVAGGALMYTVDQDTDASRVYGYTVLIGASFSVAQAVVDTANVPAAIGFITLAQFLGNTTALAIANAIFLNLAETKLQALLPDFAPDQIQAAISGVTEDFIERLGPDVRARVVEAIVTSMDKTYILVISAGSLVAVLSLFMKREKLFITQAAGGP